MILLFNEGEELGLVGARAFLADPLSRNVDSLLNFEARGVNGPVTMFETSQPNGPAISVFGHAVRRPVASSMSTDIARLIPNDTDVTVYKERGWLTLNFAMVGNETRYHSPGDDVAGLDPRSLQHMGDQALATATELSGGVPRARGNRIFFDVAGRSLIQMPMALGMGLFVLLLAAFTGIAWKRGAIVREPATVLAAIVAAERARLAGRDDHGRPAGRDLLASASGNRLRRHLRDGAVWHHRDPPHARREDADGKICALPSGRCFW